MKKLIIINILLITIYSILPIQDLNKQKIIETLAEVPVVEEIVEKIEEKEEIKISFEFEQNLLTPSNITAEQLGKAFEGTAMKGLEEYFIQAEKETGINALYIAGLAVHESGWNTSDFAKTRNNLFGWQAYDNNLNATKRFESKEQCILFVADKIKTLYLEEDGMFHSGYTMASISKRYASDPKHAQKTFTIIQELLDRMA